MNNKALLVISFGTSYTENCKKTILAAENALARAFPDYTLKRAFTSTVVIHKLKERDNLVIDTVHQAVQKLLAEGYRHVLAQPLHVINGVEYDLLSAELASYKQKFEKLIIGYPLLTHHADYLAVVEALCEFLPQPAPGEAVILMGHGSEHHANAAYAALDYVFKDEGLRNVHVGTVEGYPTLETVLKRLEADRIQKVTLMPFMLVAGDHAQNDMAGSEEDSWKSILESRGYQVDVLLKGLGEIEKIRQIYVAHARAALERAGK
jgi:sirohydrochlorin cobaltochelatase